MSGPEQEVGWEQRFDKKFGNLCMEYSGNEGSIYAHGSSLLVKQFIRETLASEKAQELEWVRKMVEGIKRPIDKSLGYEANRYDAGNNDALDDVLKALDTES